MQAFEAALRLNPTSAPYHAARGDALRALGRFEEALLAYEQALQLDPRNATWYVDKGSTLLLLERPQEALVALERVLQLVPGPAAMYQPAMVYRLLGSALQRLGRIEEAQQAYEKARLQ